MLGRKSMAFLMVVPLLLASCGSAGPTPQAGTPANSLSPTSDSSPTAEETTPTSASESADQTPSTEPTEPAPPPPPTDFTATILDGSVPCPSPDAEGGESCKQTDLAWQSPLPGSWFRVYTAWTGEGDATCSDASMLDQAQPILETQPDTTSAHLYSQLATGGGAQCLWITAVTDAGESVPVAAQGQ